MIARSYQAGRRWLLGNLFPLLVVMLVLGAVTALLVAGNRADREEDLRVANAYDSLYCTWVDIPESATKPNDAAPIPVRFPEGEYMKLCFKRDGKPETFTKAYIGNGKLGPLREEDGMFQLPVERPPVPSTSLVVVFGSAMKTPYAVTLVLRGQ